MTASTKAIYTTLRTQVLTFQALGSPTPDTLQTSLGGRLYVVQARGEVTYPYGIMWLRNAERPGDYYGERMQVELEIQLFHRPRAKQYDTEGFMDIADQALLRYVDASSGLIFSRAHRRDTLPVFAPPADREVVAVRTVHDLVIWPAFITQYA